MQMPERKMVIFQEVKAPAMMISRAGWTWLSHQWCQWQRVLMHTKMMEVRRLLEIRSRCLVSVHSEQLKVVSAKPHSNLENQFTTLTSTAWPGQLLSQFKIMLMPCLCPKRLPTLRRRLKEKRKKRRPQKIRLSRNNRKLLVLRCLRRKSVSFHTQSLSHSHLPNL